MASLFMGYRAKFLLILAFLMSSSCFTNVMCAEFEVGGDKGWVTPPSKNDQIYNQWASKNRFNVGDSLRFKYDKDSVLVVTDEEYDKCKSSHPIFFSNNGDTDFKLDRPGLFYFISGVAGHCERGLKMIIKVLELESPPAQPSSDQTNGGAVQVATTMSFPPVVMLWGTFHVVLLGFNLDLIF